MNTEKLLKILQIQAHSYNQFRMFAYIIRQLQAAPDCTYYTDNGNIYVTKGAYDNYPCLVAHMDTVHEIVEDLSAIRVGERVTGFNRHTMKQSGIGGDDKVGIFIALECLFHFDCIKIVFFRDEEVGCHGSSDPHLSFFCNCNFVMQCDRQGNSDFVIEAGNIPLCSEEFRKSISHILTSFKYNFNKGYLTDVVALKECSIDCSMANISCGYYRPHTEYEYVNLKDVERCLNLVKNIIHEIGNIRFPHVFEPPSHDATFRYFYEPIFSAHCRDCWAPDVTQTGYCKTCNDYYHFNDF